jgi:hypothetical protein
MASVTALFISVSCNRLSSNSDESSGLLTINRFDSALYNWVDTDTPEALAILTSKYAKLLSALDRTLFEEPSTDTAVFYDRLINYYSEPTLKSLFHDAITYFSVDSTTTQTIQKELTEGLERLSDLSLTRQLPAIYFHVSGLRQNIIIADSLLSCSIDKYLGSGYPLYNDYLRSYQRSGMIAERVVPDCLSAWLRAEHSFSGNEYVLAERMLYEGKILYVLSRSGNYPLRRSLSLSEREELWFKEYERSLWTFINEHNRLYMPDIVSTSKFFQSAPSLFITPDAPGNVGSFIGYRIVEQYMQTTGISCEELMQETDFQDVLKKSKYKPL